MVSEAASWACAGLECAQSGAQALAAWRQRRHPFVFADLSRLADAMTGAGLCAAIRQERHGHAVFILLMADPVHPHQQAWARRHGADGLIPRSADDVLKAARRAGLPTHFPWEPTLLAGAPLADGLVRVEAALQQFGHLGPARSLVVAEAWASLQVEDGDSQPTLGALVDRVAEEIEDPAARSAFVRSFKAAR